MNRVRRLIVNADDFGLSRGVNRGIIEAHEQGILTSTSLMVRAAAAREAADYARAHPRLSVGLHVDLCEWTFTDSQWTIRYEVVPLTDAVAVAEEVAKQLESFRRLVGRAPTHLDSHQHVHRDEPLRTILTEHALKIGVPVRGFHPLIQYCGAFYGQSAEGYPYPQAISADSLTHLIETLPTGITELGCHPGYSESLDSTYKAERVVECASLCDPQVRRALVDGNVELISFDFPCNACLASFPATADPSPSASTLGSSRNEK